MIIKKYQAKTEAEALENAKKELGQGIVLMNVRPVKPKGLFSFLKSPVTEITVALEEEPEQPKTDRRETAQTIAFHSAVSEAAQAVTEKLKESGDIDREPGRAQENSTDGRNKKEIEERLDNLRSLIEENLVKSDKTVVTKEEEDTNTESESVAFLKLLYNTMIANEIHEKYANQFIDNLEKIDQPNVPMDYILSGIYQKMVLKFGVSSVITPAENGAKLVFFIGPTGVGKTTTIAKIASKFCVEQKKKVVLLTADTYRIAAAEQLRTYASILDIPFRVIYSPEEIQSAIRDFQNVDYILVDTAGHSHNNEAQREAMKELLHSVDDLIESETYLVVSATTKYRDLISITDTYTDMVRYKLIFTKLDETQLLGNLLNVRMHTGAEMSYVTCGQNVPDDIEEFNPQKTVKQLLGGKKQ